MLRPLQMEGGPFVCLHWRTWPPALSVHDEEVVIRLKTTRQVSDIDFQRWQIWLRDCGKQRMDALCQECPMVRRAVQHHQTKQVFLETLDGTFKSPAVDLPTIESLQKPTTLPTIYGQGLTPNARQQTPGNTDG